QRCDVPPSRALDARERPCRLLPAAGAVRVDRRACWWLGLPASRFLRTAGGNPPAPDKRPDSDLGSRTGGDLRFQAATWQGEGRRVEHLLRGTGTRGKTMTDTGSSASTRGERMLAL